MKVDGIAHSPLDDHFPDLGNVGMFFIRIDAEEKDTGTIWPNTSTIGKSSPSTMGY